MPPNVHSFDKIRPFQKCFYCRTQKEISEVVDIVKLQLTYIKFSIDGHQIYAAMFQVQ